MAGTRRTREVIFAGDLDPAPILDDIIDLADEQKVTSRELSRSKFESMTRTDGAQGVLAMAQPLRPTPLDELLRPERDGTPPFILLLDGITDPGNLGAILRTAECAGVTGVVLPRHRAAHITPTVAKTAAGAVEHLRMSVVGGLPAAMKTLSQLGIWTVGLDAGGERASSICPLPTSPLRLCWAPRVPACLVSCASAATRSPASRWPVCSTASMSRTPQQFRSTRSPVVALRRRVETEPATGIEPATCCLQDSCSTN